MEHEVNYAELIEKLQKLSETKQATVLDFVNFLVERNEASLQENKILANSSLADLMRNPLRVAGFTPLSREEANASNGKI